MNIPQNMINCICNFHMFQDDNVAIADGGNVAEATWWRSWDEWYVETVATEDTTRDTVGWGTWEASSTLQNTDVYNAPGYEYRSISGTSLNETGATGVALVNEV